MAGTTGAVRTLKVQRVFAAPRERVFRAFTDPAQLKRWHAPGDATVSLAEVDLKVGGAYRIHMQGADGTVYRLRGEYREIDAPSRLIYTWRWEHEDDGVEMLVTVEFADSGEDTLVRLTHEGFASEESRGGHEGGWSSILDKLEALL